MICALGDLLLDVIVRVDGPISADTDTYGRTAVAPGGQAANVAAWVAALGGEARFAGKRARDPAGRIVAEALVSRGVDVVGPEVAAGTGTVVSLAGSDGGRTMLTDRGVAPDLRADELDPRWFACRFLHVPSYSLVRSPIREAAFEAVRISRTGGASVSVDLSSTSSILAYGAERFAVLVSELRPDVVFGNEAEFALVGALDAPTIVVKRGARGCLVTTGDGSEDRPAKPATVVDGTGAGDALAAGFLLGGADLGLEAAARCVATAGGFPP